MKIVNREEFLKLTPPVIYSKVNCGCILPGIYAATKFIENDWFFNDLSSTANKKPLDSDSFYLNYQALERDGSFEDETVEFLIYELADISSLADTLNGYVGKISAATASFMEEQYPRQERTETIRQTIEKVAEGKIAGDLVNLTIDGKYYGLTFNLVGFQSVEQILHEFLLSGLIGDFHLDKDTLQLDSRVTVSKSHDVTQSVPLSIDGITIPDSSITIAYKGPGMSTDSDDSSTLDLYAVYVIVGKIMDEVD